jgi:hypothetical protein
VPVGVDDDAGAAVVGVDRRAIHRRPGVLRPLDGGVDVGDREVEGDGDPTVVRTGQAELGERVGEVEGRSADLDLRMPDPVVVHDVGITDRPGAQRRDVPGDGRAGVADDEVRDQLRWHAADPAVRRAVTEGPGSRRTPRPAARR